MLPSPLALTVLVALLLPGSLPARSNVGGSTLDASPAPETSPPDFPVFPAPIEGLPYGPEPYMVADLQLSLHTTPRPLIVYLHGGGGVAPASAMKYDSASRPWLDFLAAGYPILSAHYGNALEGAVYPAQNDAVRELFIWVHEQLLPDLPELFDGRVILWGVSQGGLLGLNESYRRSLPSAYKPDLAVAWVAPTAIPYLTQDTDNVLASYFTGVPYSQLSDVPKATQLRASPAWTLLQDPTESYVPTLVAYWVPPAPIELGDLDDVHHGLFGELLVAIQPETTALYYPTSVGPLPPEIAMLDESYPAVQTIAWLQENL